MSLERKEIFEFGEFRLDADERTIERLDGTRNGTLTEKAFQALVLLVQHQGHLVSKDELIRFVWPDTIVEDNNLEKCIHHLRKFLGETKNGRKYIETVRKHGYRFVGKVDTVEVGASWLPDTFKNFDENGSAGTINNVPIESNLAKSDNTVATRFASVKKEFHPFRSAIVLAGVVMLLIGGILGLGYLFILPGEEANPVEFQAKRGTNHEEANRFYLMAMNLSEERGIQNVQKSLEYLDRAVALDPNYAHAWAAKAHTHRDIASHGVTDQHEQYQRSMDAIAKALAIDPNLSEAYSALCHNKNRYEYDAAGAEKACKRALELDPNSAFAHKVYSNFLYSRGRFDEAIVEIKKAMDLQPVSYRNQQIYALALYYARRYGEAEAEFKRLIELNPNHTHIHNRLIMVLEQQGNEPEAFEYLVEMLTIQKADNEELERFKTAYQTGGWRGVVIERIKRAEASKVPGNFQLACLYAKIGETDKTLEYLEKAYQERSFLIAILQVEPQLDSVRNDPRFANLITRAYGN